MNCVGPFWILWYLITTIRASCIRHAVAYLSMWHHLGAILGPKFFLFWKIIEPKLQSIPKFDMLYNKLLRPPPFFFHLLPWSELPLNINLVTDEIWFQNFKLLDEAILQTAVEPPFRIELKTTTSNKKKTRNDLTQTIFLDAQAQVFRHGRPCQTQPTERASLGTFSPSPSFSTYRWAHLGLWRFHRPWVSSYVSCGRPGLVGRYVTGPE